MLAYIKWIADSDAAASRLRDTLASDSQVTLGGTGPVDIQLNSTITADLARAEMIAFPILFLLSLWVFRGVVAALMPLLIGAVTILGTFLGLWVIASRRFRSMRSTSARGWGWGLSIDYSLFMVSRYREELARGLTPTDAIRRTLGTAGRTVFFSALTIPAAMASLLVFPLKFLYSMGAAGILVAVLASTVALLVLPAFIELSSRRVHLAGCTANPSAAWVAQQARQLAWRILDGELRPRFLLRDRDAKFTRAFDKVFRSEGVEVIRVPFGRPWSTHTPIGGWGQPGARSSITY